MVEAAASPPSDAGSIHWRAWCGSKERFDIEPLAELLCRAVAGTALAGYAFPTVMAVASICSGHLGVGEAVALLLAAVVLVGITSGFLAFTVSIPVALFAGVVGRLIGVSDRDIWFASLVGGWSGYFACHLVFGGTGAGEFFGIVAIAVATGQIGAGAYAYRGQSKSGRAEQSDEVRFGVRQLFGVTTAVAVLTVVARALSKRGDFVSETAVMAVGIQAAIIGLGIAARVYARRRRAMSTMSREALAQVTESTQLHVERQLTRSG